VFVIVHSAEFFLLWFLFSREVKFCGYTIPHPSEDKMHLRIEMYTKTSPLDALKDALEQLDKVCELIENRFEVKNKALEYIKELKIYFLYHF
jgi:DNA-directed RNA polymerase I and III subunit RPAC2